MAAMRRTAAAVLIAVATLATLFVTAAPAGAVAEVFMGPAVATPDVYEGGTVSLRPVFIECDGFRVGGRFMNIRRFGETLDSVLVDNGWTPATTIDADLPPGGPYELVGHFHICMSSTNVEVSLGSYTVHSRDTTTDVLVAPASPVAGDTANVTVEVANTGPEDTTGTINVDINGERAYTGVPLTRGAATFDTTPLEAGANTVEVTYLPEGPWRPSSSTVSVTATPPPPEVPEIPSTTFPGTVPAGDDIFYAFNLVTTNNDLTEEYLTGATVTVDGVDTGSAVEVIRNDGRNALVGGTIELGDRVEPGPRTATITFPAHGNLSHLSKDVTFTVAPVTSPLTVSGPDIVTWGESFNLTVTADGDLPVDGTFTVFDGTDAVGSAPAGVGAIVVAVSNVGVGDGRELDVRHTGATFYADSSETFTLDVRPVPVGLDVSVDQLTAGVPTTVTVDVDLPVAPTPAGDIDLLVAGQRVMSSPVSEGTFTYTFVPTAGDVEVTADYGPAVEGFAPATATSTPHFVAMKSTVTAVHTYRPPTRPNSTGDVNGPICLNAVHPDAAPEAFTGADVSFTVVHHITGTTQTTTARLGPHANCMGYSTSNRIPGEYTMTISFAGNDYLAASTGTSHFTVQHAPTEMGLSVVGDHGDRYGLMTTLRADLSAPVSKYDHTGNVEFFANGVLLGGAPVVGGAATLDVRLPAGDDVEVTASYTGDPVHAPVTSAPLFFDVAQATATVTLSVTPERATLGETSTLTATVTVDQSAMSAAFAALAVPFSAPRAAASAPGTPAEGTVTFYVNGGPVGTHALVGGNARMPYVFGLGNNTVSVSYSGSPDVEAVAAGVVAPVDVTVVEPPSPPVPSTDPTFPPADPAEPSAQNTTDDSYTGGRSVGRMPRTGAGTRTLLTVASVLLGAGVALVRVRRRTT